METSDTATLVAQQPLLAERFKVLTTLGQGAAGTVYHVADQQNSGKELALKVLTNRGAFDEKTYERFVQEIEVCTSLSHPNLVQAYDFIQLKDTVAFSMEYVEGVDLGRLFFKKRFQPQEIEHIFDQLLAGLSELHAHGIVHRDIKLENVLVRNDGQVKLSDLGLVKQLDSRALTGTGVLLGTAHYMPPEYARSSVYDERGDLYACGVMLYEVVTGQRRLGDLGGAEALEYLLRTKFAAPVIEVEEPYRRFTAVIERAMAVKPEQRFQSAPEMRRALKAAVRAAAGTVPANTNARVEKKRSAARPPMFRWYHAAAFFAAASSAILGAVLVLSTQGNSLLERLPNGVYQGALVSEGGHTVYAAAELERSGKEVLFRSDLDECKTGSVHLSSGAVDCALPGFQLIPQSVSDSSMNAVLKWPYGTLRFDAERVR